MSSTALSVLVSRLQEDVPARNSIPSADQAERAVIDAVADFSRKAGRMKIGTLSIVSGQASYTLPADFVSMIRIYSMFAENGIINSGQGLIPTNARWNERHVIADGVITFYPTPTYSISRGFEYKAGWVLETASYDEMGDTEAGIVLLLAAAKVLHLQANKTVSEAWTYQIGDERVSKERLSEQIRLQSDAMQAKYLDALQTYKGNAGAAGRRSSYSLDAYS